MEDFDGNLYGLSSIPVITIAKFLELLLELGHGFLFLGTGGDGLETNAKTSGINAEALGTKLFIDSYKSHRGAEGSDSGVLRVFLKILSHPVGQNSDWDSILIFVLELGSGVPQVCY